MIWPLVESLNAMRPQLPRALFTRRAVGRMLSIARAARGSMDAFGFECRLARGAERVDLGTRLKPGAAAAGLARDFAEMVRTVRSLFNPYRPELHYMRGPGPAWRAKHAPGPAPASLNGAPALAPAQAG